MRESSRNHSRGRPAAVGIGPKVSLSTFFRDQGPYVCGALALPVLALSILAATLVTPGYSHVTDTISHLGGREGPRPWVFNTGFFLGGLLVWGFAYGFARQFGASTWGKLLTALLVINATTAIFAAIFESTWGAAPLDASVVGDSIHEIAARASFTALTTAMVLFPVVVWQRPEWRGVLWLFLALAISAVLFGLLFLFEVFAEYSGVIQRVFFAMCCIWLEVVSIQSLRIK
jgi:hypothetical membrane protein